MVIAFSPHTTHHSTTHHSLLAFIIDFPQHSTHGSRIIRADSFVGAADLRILRIGDEAGELDAAGDVFGALPGDASGLELVLEVVGRWLARRRR